MKTALKGLWSATATLADGTRRTYFYAWKGGPRLCDETGAPILDRHHPGLSAAFHAARQQRSRAPAGTISGLIEQFRRTSEFRQEIAPRTRADYERHLAAIDDRFGTMPLAALGARQARGLFKAWRDERAQASRRQADYGWSVLARLFSVGKDRGWIDHNPCENGGRLYRAQRQEKIWTAADEAAFYAAAPPHLHLALTLALWTGQRQGDMLALTWPQVSGGTIRLQQGKTGKRLAIPIGAPLQAALDAARPASPQGPVLRTLKGEAWTEDGFRVSWRKACAKAGIRGLTFHDIRGTAITRLSLSSATVPQIAAITGHSLKDAEAILDAHYLSRDAGLAEQAIVKLQDWKGRK